MNKSASVNGRSLSSWLRASRGGRVIALSGVLASAGLLPNRMAGEIQLANGLLTFDASLAGTYDSNASGGSLDGEMFYLTLSPRLSYERIAARFRTRLNAGVSFERQLTSPKEESQYFNYGAFLGFEPGAWGTVTADVRADYTESFQTDYAVNARVFTRTTSAAANGGATFGHDTTLKLSGLASRAENENYPSADTYSFDADVHKALGRSAGVFVGYRHWITQTTRTRNVLIPLDQSSDQFSAGLSKSFASGIKTRAGVGYTEARRSTTETLDRSPGYSGANFLFSAEGPFLPPRLFPKLTSSFRISYGQPDVAGINDVGQTELTGALNVSWKARPDTTMSVTADRRQELTVTSLSVINSTVRLALDQTLRQRLTVGASVGYEWIEYNGVNRDTEAFVFTARAQRQLGTRKRWSTSAMYTYRDSNSSDFRSTFAQHMVTASISYRY